MKKQIRFKVIELIYTILDENFNLVGKLYRAYIDETTPPIYLYDDKDIVSMSKMTYSIVKIKKIPIDIEERDYLVMRLRDTRIRNYFHLHNYLYQAEWTFDDWDLDKYTDGIGVSEHYNNLLKNLFSYKAEKDPRLITICRATVLGGIEMQYQPHSIISANPNTGKTTFYEFVGKRFDKAMRSTLTTRSRGGKIMDILNGQRFPVCLEQLEGHELEDILAFLSSFLELGKAGTAVAGIETGIQGTSTLVITLDLSDHVEDKLAPMRDLIEVLTKNSAAMGKRFGIIACGEDFEQVKGSEYFDEREYIKIVEEFRIIEERARPVIKAIYDNPAVKGWLNATIEGYNKSLAKDVDDPVIKKFLDHHLEGAHRHIKGGALNSALVDYLPILIHHDITKERNIDGLAKEIVAKAEKYLKDIILINKDMIKKVSS